MKKSKKQFEIVKKRLVTGGLIVVIAICWLVIGVKIKITADISTTRADELIIPSTYYTEDLTACGKLIYRVNAVNMEKELKTQETNPFSYNFCSGGNSFYPDKDSSGAMALYSFSQNGTLGYYQSIYRSCFDVYGLANLDCLEKINKDAFWKWQCCPEGVTPPSEACTTCQVKRSQLSCSLDPRGEPMCQNGTVAEVPKPVKDENGQWKWSCVSEDKILTPQWNNDLNKWGDNFPERQKINCPITAHTCFGKPKEGGSCSDRACGFGYGGKCLPNLATGYCGCKIF